MGWYPKIRVWVSLTTDFAIPLIANLFCTFGGCIVQDESTRLAEKWTDLLKTGSINAKIYAVDRATIMFILSYGQDTTEVNWSLVNSRDSHS